MIITKKELQEKLKQEVVGLTDPAKVFEKILQQLRFSVENYDQLDPEAKQVVDSQLSTMDQMNTVAMETLKTQPDSVVKREKLRMHRAAKGSHFDVKQLLADLADEPKKGSAMLSDAQETFIFVAQIAYNYLCDITEGSLEGGGVALVQLSLFYCAMEEAGAAFHLASRSYAPQAFTHIRNIRETLDLIELFQLKPEFMDFWASEDYKERQKVAPKEVRKALGKDQLHDDVYWMLSDFGSHPSFKYMRTKTQILRGAPDPHFRINVGGVANPFHTQQALVACLAAAQQTLGRIIAVFQNCLLEEETERDGTAAIERVQEFLRKHTDFPNTPQKEGR